MLRARLLYPEAVLRSLVAESMLSDFQLQNSCRHSLIRIFCLLSLTPTDIWLLQKIPCIRLFHEKNLFHTSRCDTNKLLYKPSITTLSIALFFKHKACFGVKGHHQMSTIKELRKDFLICVET
jgi:hypothetical protein